MTSVSCPTYMINSITADSLMEFADVLEKAEDKEAAARQLIRDTYLGHKRIVFNGNNYSEEWVQEAERRGLLNLKSAVDAFPCFTAQKNRDMFARQHVFTEVELRARQEILFDEYCKVVNIEALTMRDMVTKQVLPAVSAYTGALAQSVQAKRQAAPETACAMEQSLISSLSSASDCLFLKVNELDQLLLETNSAANTEEQARLFCHKVLPVMNEMRVLADELETNTAADYWPMPTYGQLLFG